MAKLRKEVSRLREQVKEYEAETSLDDDDAEDTEAGGGSTGGGSKKRRRDASRGGKECLLCMSAPKSVALDPCGHVCLCAECAKKFGPGQPGTAGACPVCRSSISRKLTVYL